MNRVQIDNSYLAYKIKLRVDNLPAKKAFSVLDCFSGAGLIWEGVRAARPNLKIQVVGIDKKTKTGRLHLIGDNMKFLSSLKLENFDIIDLDAYGMPYRQLQAALRAKLKKGVIIYVTFIQSLYGALPSGLLADLGYTSQMIEKIPTLFYRHGLDKLKQYLATNGVKTIKYYSDSSERKHYLCFHL